MNIDRETFIAWMERIMDRFDMQDKKIDRLITQRNCLDREQLLDNQDLMSYPISDWVMVDAIIKLPMFIN